MFRAAQYVLINVTVAPCLCVFHYVHCFSYGIDTMGFDPCGICNFPLCLACVVYEIEEAGLNSQKKQMHLLFV